MGTAPRTNFPRRQLRRSQRVTPWVRRAPMAPTLTSPTRFTFTHRIFTQPFQRWRGSFFFGQNEALSASTGARYPARPLRPTGTDWSPSQKAYMWCFPIVINNLRPINEFNYWLAKSIRKSHNHWYLSKWSSNQFRVGVMELCYHWLWWIIACNVDLSWKWYKSFKL